MNDFEVMLEECEDEQERNDLMYLEAADIAADRAILAYETYCNMDSLNTRAAACKAATMGDNFDGMVAFYEEQSAAEEKSTEKKANLLKRMWAAVKKFFTDLADKIRAKFRTVKIDKKAVEDVPEDVANSGNIFAKAGKAIQDFATKHTAATIAALTAALAAIAGITFVATKGKRTKKMTGEQATKSISMGQKVIDLGKKLAAKYETQTVVNAEGLETTYVAQGGKLIKSIGTAIGHKLIAIGSHFEHKAQVKEMNSNAKANRSHKNRDMKALAGSVDRKAGYHEGMMNRDDAAGAAYQWQYAVKTGNVMNDTNGWNESVDEDSDLDIDSETFNEEWELEIDSILADI